VPFLIPREWIVLFRASFRKTADTAGATIRLIAHNQPTQENLGFVHIAKDGINFQANDANCPPEKSLPLSPNFPKPHVPPLQGTIS
jgi:hypothetical protein